MIWTTSTVLSFAVCVLSLPKDRHQRQDLSHIDLQKQEHHDGYAWPYPSYEFSYKVDDPHTHDKKGQHEHRSGDDVVGNYWLIQPDGQKRYIKYHVDGKSGFIASVNYTSPHSRVNYDAIKKRADKNKSDKKEELGTEIQKNIFQEDRDRKREDSIDDNKSMQSPYQEKQQKDGRENKKQEPKDLEKSHEERQMHKQKGRQPSDENNDRNGDDKKPSSQLENQDKTGIKNRDSEYDSPTDIIENGGYSDDDQSEHRSGKEKFDKENLWAGLKGWTIIHDIPKYHEKPVWEWDSNHDRSWPETHTWNENQSREKSQNYENKQIKTDKVRKNNDDKVDGGEDQFVGGEERSKINNGKRGDEKEKQLDRQKGIKINKNQQKIDQERRANSEGSREGINKYNSGDNSRRWGGGMGRPRGKDNQDKQEVGEGRQGYGENNRRDGKHHRDNMDRGDRQPYYNQYTPIAYVQRY